jgi:hypothetical protein
LTIPPFSFKQKRKIQSRTRHCDLLLQAGGLELQTPIVLFTTMQEMVALPTSVKGGSQL